jgi:hypothetical protein
MKVTFKMLFVFCHYHEGNWKYAYAHTRLFKSTCFYFQSEEDKQLQEELNMLVERLQVSINLTIFHKSYQQFLVQNMCFINANTRRWVKIMSWNRISEGKSQHNRIKSWGKIWIKYSVVKLDEQFLQLKSELWSERKYLHSVFVMLC